MRTRARKWTTSGNVVKECTLPAAGMQSEKDAKIYARRCSSQPSLWGWKPGNSSEGRHRDWLNKLWDRYVMEYHTAIKNDGPVKEYFNDTGKCSQNIFLKKGARIAWFVCPWLCYNSDLKWEAQGLWDYLWYWFTASETSASLISVPIWLSRKHKNLMCEGHLEYSLCHLWVGWPWDSGPHFSSSVRWAQHSCWHGVDGY